jgi:hypothetical protein
MSEIYQWKRFWCPRGTTINLSDGGFLPDPDAEYGKLLNPDLVAFEKLVDKPCLALLGEPGIGKSWALKTEKTNLGVSVCQAGGRSVWLDLRSFGSEERLYRALFESAELDDWRTSNYVLNLFLDSLDECLLRIDNVASLIADQLPKEPTNRLRIRIACRTAPWPELLGNALTAIYGDSGFEAYELVPLRRRDVDHALERRGVNDRQSFFDRVEVLDVSSFAIKPVTLNFLINTYLRERDLPANQIELYERGCRILCEEANASRTAAGKRGSLSVEDRFAIASRIAGITQFCNRFAVWTESEASTPPEDVPLKDIIGAEQVGDGELSVSPDTIREVLDTGLFSSRGPGRIGWAHQTYAEFLAARYCIRHQMPVQQVQSLLFHPEGSGERLVPQLYDVAGWISVANSKVLESVISADPESLLGAAGASLSETQRKLIVRSLLDQSEKGRLLSLRWRLFRLYPKLSHPTIAEQLRPYVLDDSIKLNTKHVVLDLVRACKVDKLGPELISLALDPSQPAALRIAAGAAAAEAGSAETRARLRPFAVGEAGDDPDDEMKGIGLKALWPDLMNAKEMFPLLTRPKDWHLHGAYASFLYSLASRLKRDDLPAALEWFTSQQQRDIGPIDSLMDNIICMAVENADAPDVIDELVNAILSRVTLNDRLTSGFEHGELAKQIRTNHALRQELLTRLLPRVSESALFYLDYAGVSLVPDVDLPWLIHRLDVADSARTLQMEVKLIYRIVDTRQRHHMQALWSACQVNPALNAEFKDLFFIPLDSETARILRQNLEYQQKPEQKLIDPPPQVLIEDDLNNFEHGKTSEWIKLTLDLSLKPTSIRWEDTNNPDLTLLPGWHASSDETKQRIIAAALRYANEGEPENEKWFGTSEIYFSAIAGFKALVLLLTTAPEKFHSLSKVAWVKWVPILLKYSYVGDGKLNLKQDLLMAANSCVPDEVAMRLTQVVDLDNNKNGYLFVNREIELCWDERLAKALLEKTIEPHLKPAVVGALLHILLQHGTPGSCDVAKSFIIVPPPQTDPQKSLMVAAIEAVLSGAPGAGWPDIWPTIRDHPDFGRFVIGAVSYKHGGAANFITKLTENQLGEFYVWMLMNYPPLPNDHRHSGAVGEAQTAVMLRDQTLEHLKNRGTFAACEAIREAMARLPQHPWLGYHLEEAELLARAATWQPVGPQRFLELVRDRQRRLIENAEQLLAVVSESLDRLQVKFKGELPASKDLWNSDKGQYWPKDEEDVSDYVVRHLDEDIRGRGIVVNREVQIRRGIGGGTGQFTDIHVDAVVAGAKPGTYSRLYVIVESKGNWNQDLFTAMETQLRDRYLKDNRCQSGIYLVGWFSCEKWKQDDQRKRRCPSMSIVEARCELAQQAAALSTDGFQIQSYVLDLSLG